MKKINKIPQEQTLAIAFPKATYQAKDILSTILFLIAATILPALLAHTPANQWITGTVVNALLFLAVWRVGLVNAILIAVIPSSIALMRGLLSAPLAIMIPYIIASNVLLIAVFYTLKKHPIAGMISGSLVKFLFLAAITSLALQISSPLLYMFQWPQLFTALAGGLIATTVIKISEKKSA